MSSVFVVNADDLGLAESANEGIFKAHNDGIVTSASLVVTTPALDHALRGISDCPSLGIGLHFSLSAGKCVAPRNDVPDLIDSDGFLRCRFTQMLLALSGKRGGSLLRQIEVELDAQIRLMHRIGIKPDHVNGERHIHLLPGIVDIVRKATIKYEIGHIRMLNDIGLSYLRAQDLAMSTLNGGLIKFALLRRLTNMARARWENLRDINVQYASMLYTGHMDVLLRRIWEKPPAGITELAVHPGLPGKGTYKGIGNTALARYLQSENRLRELNGCLQLARKSTIAKLSTFAELSDSINA